MITEVKDIDKVKVNYWVLTIGKEDSLDYTVSKIDKIVVTEYGDKSKVSFFSSLGYPEIFLLLESSYFDDYVFENKKEMENNFPEYFI
jgi:hypothetical protein